MQASDFARSAADRSWPVTWYPAANTGDPRTINTQGRELKPEEWQGGHDERGYLLVIHIDEISGQGVEPVRDDLVEWDGLRCRVIEARKAPPFPASPIFYRLEVAG